MNMLSKYLLSASFLLALASCSKHNVQGNMFTLIGKWRTEKRDTTQLVEAAKREGRGLPPQMIEPILEKLKKGGEITGEWEFKPDGSGTVGQTGEQQLPITWRIVRSDGDSLVLEIGTTKDKSRLEVLEVVFDGNDKFSMRPMRDDEENGEAPTVYRRIR